MGGPRQFSKLTDQLFSLFFGAKRDFIASFNWGYNHFRCVARQKKEMKHTQAHASTLCTINKTLKFEVLFDSAITKPTSDLWAFWHRRVSTTLSNPRPAVPAQPKIPMPLNPTTT